MKSKVFERISANIPEYIKIKVDSYCELLFQDHSKHISDCNHIFIVRNQYWCSCSNCGMIIPNEI